MNNRDAEEVVLRFSISFIHFHKIYTLNYDMHSICQDKRMSFIYDDVNVLYLIHCLVNITVYVVLCMNESTVSNSQCFYIAMFSVIVKFI